MSAERAGPSPAVVSIQRGLERLAASEPLPASPSARAGREFLHASLDAIARDNDWLPSEQDLETLGAGIDEAARIVAASAIAAHREARAGTSALLRLHRQLLSAEPGGAARVLLHASNYGARREASNPIQPDPALLALRAPGDLPRQSVEQALVILDEACCVAVVAVLDIAGGLREDRAVGLAVTRIARTFAAMSEEARGAREFAATGQSGDAWQLMEQAGRIYLRERMAAAGRILLDAVPPVGGKGADGLARAYAQHLIDGSETPPDVRPAAARALFVLHREQYARYAESACFDLDWIIPRWLNRHLFGLQESPLETIPGPAVAAPFPDLHEMGLSDLFTELPARTREPAREALEYGLAVVVTGLWGEAACMGDQPAEGLLFAARRLARHARSVRRHLDLAA